MYLKEFTCQRNAKFAQYISVQIISVHIFFCIFFIIHEEQIELFKTAAFVFVCLETNFKSVF